MDVSVTDCKFWRCPKCAEVLEKGLLGTMLFPGQVVDISGTGTCGKCGAAFPEAEIYGGTYDFVGVRPTAVPTDMAPTRISVVIFREGSEPPADTERYYRQIVHDRYGDPQPKVESWRMVGRSDPPTAADAATHYARLSEAGQLPKYGQPSDEFEGTGPDGNKIAVLFFWHDSRRDQPRDTSAAANKPRRKWWQFWVQAEKLLADSRPQQK